MQRNVVSRKILPAAGDHTDCVWTVRGLQEEEEETERTHVPLIVHLNCSTLLFCFLVFLEIIFCETVQGKGMGKYKIKTAKASIYGRRNWKKRRGD
jgi:hypothetical protein